MAAITEVLPVLLPLHCRVLKNANEFLEILLIRADGLLRTLKFRVYLLELLTLRDGRLSSERIDTQAVLLVLLPSFSDMRLLLLLHLEFPLDGCLIVLLVV